MFCTGCGNQLPEGTKVCPVCGAYFNEELEIKYQEQAATGKSAATQSGYRNMENNTQMPYQNISYGNGSQMPSGTSSNSTGIKFGGGWQPQNYNQQQENERKIKNVEELYVDKNEKQVGVLGGGYLANMLHGGGISKGFGVLTDKRYYFKGKCYTKRGMHFVKTDEEWTVDLEEITASGFIFNCKIGLLYLAIAFLVTGLLISFSVEDGISLIIGGCLFVVFLLAYALSKRSMYVITFAGGSVALDTSKYGGTKEVKKFDRKLRQTKDIALGGE